MIHPTADVSTDAKLGDGTSVWNEAQVREGVTIGSDCILGKGVYVDTGVIVGDRVKIQNRASLFRGLTVENGVYIGPHVSFTNDRYPRAVNADGSPKTDDDWELEETLVREGASIGAGAIILPGLTIGAWAVIGAASVVTRDVPEQALVTGNPAEIVGYVCTCGRPIEHDGERWHCDICGKTFDFDPAKAETI